VESVPEALFDRLNAALFDRYAFQRELGAMGYKYQFVTLAGFHSLNYSAFDLARVVAASDGFSGAEIEQAVIGALYRALHARAALTTELLLEEIRGTVPLSVSRREDVDALRTLARALRAGERLTPLTAQDSGLGLA